MPISLPSLPSWSTTKTTSKQGFDKVYNLVDKLGAPINKVTNKIGSEAFWPTTLDKESDKAARILRSFCKDGFYVEQPDTATGPKGKAKVIKKIPTEVIRNAKGLAIFTTMRTGLWVSGAGGSGILVARTATGEWSPPSGILLHTAGLGFLVGVDIYDCVVVINTDKALEAFTKIRVTLGGEISAVAGPVGVGGVLETELHKRQAPVWNYLKSRGFYAGVQIDGTVIIERGDENERFYGERISVADILAGKARHPPHELQTLMATIKAAQGDFVEASALPAEPTPGDMDIEKPEVAPGFGLPAEDDPDPFGVKALEKEGLEIKVAGTRSSPSMEVFEYKPSPSSPIYGNFRRHSVDSARRNSKRSSLRSIASIDRGTQTTDLEMSPTKDKYSESKTTSPTVHTPADITEDVDGERDQQKVYEDNHDIVEAVPEAAAPVMTKARLVTIPKRIPPSLPPRNPHRNSPWTESTDSGESPHDPRQFGAALAVQTQDRTTNGVSQISKGPELDESTDKTHSPSQPSETNYHNTPDPERLAPAKDISDEVSISGSDYSREAPIAMKDNEYDEPGKKSVEVMYQRGGNLSEEFMSVPSTPLEATSPAFQGEKVTHKTTT
ncbi:hypothetical protein G7Y79_00002g007120 [Physcia stellaris]|nr:hypothetical protein G7Y79_00002g007120 [Physcia stellaris]